MILRLASLLSVGDVVKAKHERYPQGQFVIMKEPVATPNKPGYISFVVRPTLVLHSTDLVEIVHE
jgi:hypothetical protein